MSELHIPDAGNKGSLTFRRAGRLAKRMCAFAAAFVICAAVFSDDISRYASGSEMTDGDLSQQTEQDGQQPTEDQTVSELPQETPDIPDNTQEIPDTEVNESIPDDTASQEEVSSAEDTDSTADTDAAEDSSSAEPTPDIVGPGEVMDGPGAVEAPDTENDTSGDGEEQSSAQSYDITLYAQKLQEISEEQERLEKELEETENGIEAEEKRQVTIKKKIKSVNSKIEVINSYLTNLEIEIATAKRSISDQKRDIDKGISDFKKRLRAMYLAGDESYASILLSSQDFYDVLMRMELVKRVADHDNDLITGLIEKKEEYEKSKKELEQQQAEYDAQYDELSSQRSELDRLYSMSETIKAKYEAERKLLDLQNQKYLEERSKFETDLSGILRSSYGDSSAETTRAAAELAADSKLEELWDNFAQMKEEGVEISEDECQYRFSWPVPGNYYISSGVGARWGSYHTGIDIPGAHGTDIHAAESGTVIRVNTTCTHDYGKTESCGCGGGYGNFVIIDHGNEFITLYGHMTSLDVKVGDKVKKGDVIGHMGSTGFSTGDHLHLEVRYQGYYLNPAYYVSIK